MRIGFIKISISMIVMIIALLVIFVPMWFNHFSDASVSRERIPIPPALLEVATQVDSRVNHFFSSPLLPLSQQLNDLVNIFIPTPNHFTQASSSVKTSENVGAMAVTNKAAAASQAWMITLGRFDNYQQAKITADQFRSHHIDVIILKRRNHFNVFIGPFYNRQQAFSFLGVVSHTDNLNMRIIKFSPAYFQPNLLQRTQTSTQQ